MACVYILCGSTGRHYIGSTTDLPRRVEQHRAGPTHSTRRLGQTLELRAALEVGSLTEARELERALKRKKNPRLALLLLEQRRRIIQPIPRGVWELGDSEVGLGAERVIPVPGVCRRMPAP